MLTISTPTILKKKITSQPQYPVEIDWSNSVTRGLVLAHIGSVPGVNLVDGSLGTKYGTVPTNVYEGGIGVTGSIDGGSNYWSFKTPTMNSTSQASFLVDLYNQSISGSRSMPWLYGGNEASFGRNWDNGSAFFLGGTVSSPLLGGTLSVGKRFRFGASLNGNSKKIYNFDTGVLFSTTESYGSYTDFGHSLVIADTCILGLGLIWNRPLSDVELKSLHANGIYSIFKPAKQSVNIEVELPTDIRDTTYISTSSESTCTFNLSIIADPNTSSGQSLKYRVRSSKLSNLDVQLKQRDGESASIILHKKWNEQPQYPVDINWDNNLTKDLIYAFVPYHNEVLDAVSGVRYQSGSSNIGKHGRSYGPTSPVDPVLPLRNSVSNSSAAILLNYYQGGGTRTNLLGGHNSGEGAQLKLDTNSWFGHAGGTFPIAITSIVNHTGILVATRAGTTLTTYANGAFGASAVWAATYTPPRYLNNVSGLSTQDFNAALSLYWEKTLNADEVKQLWLNPWQIFKKRKSVLYFDAPKIIATRTHLAVPDIWTQYAMDLTPSECDSITEYNKLQVSFTAR